MSLLKLQSALLQIFQLKLCDFIVKEFELEAAAIFKVKHNNNLELIGKSLTAKKSLSNEVQIILPKL